MSFHITNCITQLPHTHQHQAMSADGKGRFTGTSSVALGLAIATLLSAAATQAAEPASAAADGLETRSDQLSVREGYVLSVEDVAIAHAAARATPPYPAASGGAVAQKQRSAAAGLADWNADHQQHDRHYYHDPDIWVTDIGTLLFHDQDRDGYYAGFSLSIDVDVDYGDRDVYATLFLNRSGAAIQRLHTTEVFAIYGHSGADEYRVDAELLGNYEAGHYDLRVDIIDAHSHALVDSVTGAEFRNLDGLPLESSDRDFDPYPTEPSSGNPYPDDGGHHSAAPDPHAHTSHSGADVVVTEYAGPTSWLLSLTLGFLLAARRRTSKAVNAS